MLHNVALRPSRLPWFGTHEAMPRVLTVNWKVVLMQLPKVGIAETHLTEFTAGKPMVGWLNVGNVGDAFKANGLLRRTQRRAAAREGGRVVAFQAFVVLGLLLVSLMPRCLRILCHHRGRETHGRHSCKSCVYLVVRRKSAPPRVASVIQFEARIVSKIRRRTFQSYYD